MIAVRSISYSKGPQGRDAVPKHCIREGFMATACFEVPSGNLIVPDPFLISNSEGVVHHSRKCEPGLYTAFSVDVQELYYSIPQEQLLSCVKRCTDLYNDEFNFVTKCGVSVAAFLEI